MRHFTWKLELISNILWVIVDEMLEKKRIKIKMMDFYYCEEYLTSISNETVKS